MGEPTTTAVRVAVDGAIGRITLDRPTKHNALNRATLEELATTARWFDERDEVKVVVITGAVPSFSAGYDLRDPSWAELGPPETSARVGRVMAESIGGMRAVTVAAIRGHCIGGGVVLASACDLRVASESARFRIPEVDLGVPLYWTGVPRLVRELGPAVTKDLIMTGRTFDAAEARELRFVSRVVPDDELDGAVEELARTLAAKPSLVLTETKRQVDAAWPPVPATDPGADSDVAAFGVALADPEGLASAAAYVAGTIARP